MFFCETGITETATASVKNLNILLFYCKEKEYVALAGCWLETKSTKKEASQLFFLLPHLLSLLLRKQQHLLLIPAL